MTGPVSAASDRAVVSTVWKSASSSVEVVGNRRRALGIARQEGAYVLPILRERLEGRSEREVVLIPPAAHGVDTRERDLIE